MTDEELLESYEAKAQYVRDRVTGVASGDSWATGMYLWGKGGVSKSYTVFQQLDELKVPYQLINSRVTARGLFDKLREHPDSILVIEDAETLLDDKNASGLLRSALHCQEGYERLVTWTIARKAEQFVFTGGLIIVENKSIANSPELEAIQTRISVAELNLTNAEVAALARDIAKKGHRHANKYFLEPEQCLEVVEYVIAQSEQLNLRELVNSFKDRLQWEHGQARHHWHYLVKNRLQQRITPPPPLGIRAAKREQDLAVLKEIEALPPQERLDAWKRATGKSKAVLYKKLPLLRAAESQKSQLSA